MGQEEKSLIIQENKRRRDLLFTAYDPISGEGSPLERSKVSFYANGTRWSYGVPIAMREAHGDLLEELNTIGKVEDLLDKANLSNTPDHVESFVKELAETRFHYDFEFWAYACVKIQDKETKKAIPFKLNRSQRKVLARLEKMRLAGVPIRIIILKARQWGGSTLVQVYMAWLQIVLKMNWHSAIIADVEDQARNIRGMYTRLAKEYPSSIGKIEFVPYEGSTKNRMIVGRNCIVGVGSVQKPDSLRSFDFAMTHMSEVGLWKSTPQKSAEDLVQGVRATVPDVADSLAVLESTAKGVGNFFHREWLKAVSGESSYDPVFVAWHEIERYQKHIISYEKFIDWMQQDEYAMFLWNLGTTLEGIKWYFDTKRGENYDDWRMKSEFPSTPEEAFQSTGQRVFAPGYVQAARKNCRSPRFYGDLSADARKSKGAFQRIEFQKSDQGLLLIWDLPDKTRDVSDRYVVSVDIGGRTDKADWSVIKVFDRYWMMEGGVPEVVACWRGHLDQDLVAWKAAQIAKYYSNALLIIESNSLDVEESEGNHFLTILDEVVKYYPNIYARTDPEKLRQGLPVKYGFQTNMATKPMVIDLLNSALREEAYLERDLRACDEMDTYEVKPNGSYGAVEGCKDDMVMATAIGLWACLRHLNRPKFTVKSNTRSGATIISEASL